MSPMSRIEKSTFPELFLLFKKKSSGAQDALVLCIFVPQEERNSPSSVLVPATEPGQTLPTTAYPTPPDVSFYESVLFQ